MKLDADAPRLSRRQKTEKEWKEIYAYWDTIKGEDHATERTSEKFGCGRDKVLNAISFMIGFSKQGTKGKR